MTKEFKLEMASLYTFMRKWKQKASEQTKMEATFSRGSKKEKGQCAIQHTLWQVLVHLVH